MGRLCCCFGGRSGDKGSKVEDAKESKAVAASAGGDGGKKAGKGGGQSSVLVEFFTSQGCSSCPPADLIMSRLAQEGLGGEAPVPVLVLAYHVDIWDHLGWRDPFGSSAWSQRQRTYVEALQEDAISTPQAVVQGAAHCIGDMGALPGLISSAKRFPAPDLALTFSRPTGEADSASAVRVTGSVVSRMKIDEHKVDVMLALYEDNLVTMCDKGENRGRTLSNDSVVRALERLCTLENVAAKKSKNLEATVPLWEGFTRPRAGAVVFLQNQVTKEVYGAQQIELPEHL